VESDQVLPASSCGAGKPVSDGWCAHTFQEKFGEWPNGLSDFPMEITPEVSNHIKHKLIKFAKRRERLQQMGRNLTRIYFHLRAPVSTMSLLRAATGN
jgi:hypothetical protein